MIQSNMDMQDIQNLTTLVYKKTGLAFTTVYFMDETKDLKIDGDYVFRNHDIKVSLTGGAKSLDQLGAFLNGVLFYHYSKD